MSQTLPPRPAPPPVPADPRFRTIAYEPNQVYAISVAPGYQITIALAPDEQVQSVAVGDSGAWQVSVDHGGNHLFVKLAQSAGATNMTVITNVRLYAFDLTPLDRPSPLMTYSLQFRYPAVDAGAAAEPEAVVGRYRLSGSRQLRPDLISDDGTHVFIEWPKDSDLPAIYAVDARGHETLVNGMMRNGRMVIDGIADRFVFRIDRHSARATRIASDPDEARDAGQ